MRHNLRMVRALVLCVVVACAPAHAPPVKTVTKWAAIGGVVGIVASVLAAQRDLIRASSVVSGLAVVTYAYVDIAYPEPVRYLDEPVAAKHSRWARILTERAGLAARGGRCARVRRLELRVRGYDAEVHATQFLVDPDIAKCLAPPALPASEPVEPAVEPVVPAGPAVPAGPSEPGPSLPADPAPPSARTPGAAPSGPAGSG